MTKQEVMRQSIRDIWIVALYHLRRVTKTRAAFSLVGLFLFASMGVATAFRWVLGAMEKTMAATTNMRLGDQPGALYDALRDRGELLEFMEELSESAEAIAWAIQLPYMPFTWFWAGFILVPFLAAEVGCEAITSDIGARTLRFEAVRTGRLEIVVGRFLGMALLTLVAIALSALIPLLTAIFWMDGQKPVEQVVYLLLFIPRLWLWSLPFLAMGLSLSTLFSNINWARLFTLGLVLGSWIAFNIAKFFLNLSATETGALFIFPQAWMGGMSGGGVAWLGSGVALIGLGALYLSPGIILIKRRDL